MFQDVILSSAIYSTLMVEGHGFSFCLSFDTNKKHSSPFRKILTPIKENTIPYLLGEGIYFFENIHKQIMHMAHFVCKGKSVRNVATVSYISHSRGLETLLIYFYCFNVMTCD